MSTSTRKTTIVYSGDLDGEQEIVAANNATSPAVVELKLLTSGANTILVSTVGTAIATAVTIVPPSGNTTSITLKGVTGDTGIRIHNTDPTTIALDSSVTSFVLTAGAAVSGVRLYWS